MASSLSRELGMAAQQYAARGFRVFPVHGINTSGICLCSQREDCKDPGKHPVVAKGFKAATSDERQVRRWWRDHPSANIGLVVPDGYVVLDLDDRPAEGKFGSLKLAELERANNNAVPATITQVTPSGGRHLVFRLPDGMAVPRQRSLVPGHIDLRVGGSGYILVEPSRHAATASNGRFYRWLPGASLLHDNAADLPSWLADLMVVDGRFGRQVPRLAHESPLVVAAGAAGWLRKAGEKEHERVGVVCPWSEAGTAPVGVERRHPIGSPSSSAILPPTEEYPQGGFSCLHRCQGIRSTIDFIRALPESGRLLGDQVCRDQRIQTLSAVAFVGRDSELAQRRKERSEAFRTGGVFAWLEEIEWQVGNAPPELRHATIRSSYGSLSARNVPHDLAVRFMASAAGISEEALASMVAVR